MANLNVNVTDGNNLRVEVTPVPMQTIQVTDGNNLRVEVTPAPMQTIQISRGVAGTPSPNDIGGYPINITTPQNYDALMFVSNQWTNVPQTEIADGGNY